MARQDVNMIFVERYPEILIVDQRGDAWSHPRLTIQGTSVHIPRRWPALGLLQARHQVPRRGLSEDGGWCTHHPVH
jgi:hypothetical protein